MRGATNSLTNTTEINKPVIEQGLMRSISNAVCIYGPGLLPFSKADLSTRHIAQVVNSVERWLLRVLKLGGLAHLTPTHREHHPH